MNSGRSKEPRLRWGWISPGKGTLVGHSWVYPHMPTVDILNVTRKGSTWDAGLSSKFFLWPLLLLIALLSLFAHKNLINEKQLNATHSEGMRQNQIIVSWTIRLRTFTEAFGKYVSKNYKTRVEKQTHVFWTHCESLVQLPICTAPLMPNSLHPTRRCIVASRRVGDVNWIRDNSKLLLTEYMKSKHGRNIWRQSGLAARQPRRVLSEADPDTNCVANRVNLADANCALLGITHRTSHKRTRFT